MQTQPIAPGLCQCGCGQPTKIISGGRPRKYIHGHNKFRRGDRWVEEDCGYATPCWIWQLKTIKAGYGSVRVRGEAMAAHRWSYEQHVGPIPAGLYLDHLCRVKRCVNPAHLEPVTPAENIRRGVGAKLTHGSVAEMKLLRDQGLTYRAIADLFGVVTDTAYKAINGMSWA